MYKLILVTIAVVALLLAIAAVDAHKSVRHRKPGTEEEREQHHLEKWQLPETHEDDEHFIKNQRTEFDALDQEHKSYHRRWGPSYPSHLTHKNWHYRPPQFIDGEQVDEDIHPDDYHLFGLSKSEEF